MSKEKKEIVITSLEELRIFLDNNANEGTVVSITVEVGADEP